MDKETYEDKKLRYVVVDPTANAIVLEQGAQERAHPASLTKLLTLAMVMEAATHERTKEAFGNEVTIREDIQDNVPKELADNAYIVPGNTYTYEEMLYWTGSRSEGRTTVSLVEHLAKKDIYRWPGDHDAIREAFLQHANQRLKEIGLKDTNIRSLTGWYNDRHYTTALDIAITMDYMQSNFPNSTQISLGGVNPKNSATRHSSGLVVADRNVEWGKTGWLRQTGRSEAVYGISQNKARQDRRPLIVVVSGFDGNSRNRERFVVNLLSEAYDVVNSDNYKPESIYEDVKFDPSAALPWEPKTLSDIGKIRPRLRPQELISDDFNNGGLKVSHRPRLRPDELASQTQEKDQLDVSLRPVMRPTKPINEKITVR